MNRVGRFALAALVLPCISSCSKRQAHAIAADSGPSPPELQAASPEGGLPESSVEAPAQQEEPDAAARLEDAGNGELLGEGKMGGDDGMTLPRRGASVRKLFPADWRLIAEDHGDLNGDGVDDLAFVIQGTDDSQIELGNSEDQVADQNPRILAIYFKNAKSGMFEKRLQSNDFIMIKEQAAWEEPFAGLEIRKNRTLAIHFHFWTSWGSWSTWDSTHTFRYQGGRFKLIGYDYNVAQRNTGDTKAISVNFLTRKMIVTQGNFEGGESEEKTERIQGDALRNLDELRRGESFDELDR